MPKSASATKSDPRNISGLDASNLLGCLSPGDRTFRTPDCLSKAVGYPSIETTTITRDRC